LKTPLDVGCQSVHTGFASARVEKGSKSRVSIRRLGSLLGQSGAQVGFWRRHLWVAPLIAIVAMLAVGLWLRSRIESSLSEQTGDELTTLLRADVEAVRLWMRLQQDNAEVMAGDSKIRQLVAQFVALADAGKATPVELMQTPARQELSAELKPWVDGDAYVGYVVFNPTGLILAADQEFLIGQTTMYSGQQKFIERVLRGQASVSHPFPSRITLPGPDGEPRSGVPVMFVAAPILGADDKPIAVIALRIDPAKEFTQILRVAQPGESGETYAFDARGVMLSQSRFDNQLKQIALLPDTPGSQSVLTLELRDPGVDMTGGARPAQARKDRPLTDLAATAIAKKPPIEHPALNITGYRDYRGVDTVGACAWLPEYDLGIITEMDLSEAYRPVTILRTVFLGLLGLLAVAAVLLFLLALFAGRLQRRMRQAVIEAGQLGQYALEEKIGEGGMGSVYRARHAMLRRPTAVKLLAPSKTTDVSVARFEREVQLTSQLNHPNTITIYDYGRTAEGVFYYAMEYLDGFSLDSLVERFGPLPDGRVIRILEQVCGSLVEAHAMGLIHRDIKPANIMLTQRGGVYDFAKLLDFGLVKAVDSKKMQTLTSADVVTGTPLYLPPETIKDAEGTNTRSDLYSLGAVGYYLLTGRPLFEKGNVMEIMRAHVETPPIPPSKRLARPMSKSLEALLMKCLEKSPEHRPASAAEMAAALMACVPEQRWTTADAAVWWQQHQQTVAAESAAAVTKDVELGATVGFTDVKLASEVDGGRGA
jgi:hypothetical protein